MSDHYGYIKRTEGADGDQVDVYVGPSEKSKRVYVVNQIDQRTGRFDEHKAMLGFSNQAEAVKAYRANFDEGWKVGPVYGMSMAEFKAWLKDGDTTRPTRPVDAPREAVNQPLTTEPAGWRGNRDGASAVARSLGIDPARYRTTADLVRAIDAARSGEQVPADRPEKAQAADAPMSVGVAPGSADLVTVRDGTVYVGKHEAVNYDTGEPVTVPKGSTRADVAKALKDAGALSARQRTYGLGRQSEAVMFSRRPSTKAAYEARIDALLAGDKPKPQGVRILDRSDVLEMLGMGEGPVHLVESKVEKGRFNHGLTAADWKKVPEWLDNPAAVFDSDTSPGRLVFIAPELVRGAPVRMIVDPRSDGNGVNLLINAYDAERNPFQRWERDGLLRYFDRQKATPVTGSFQPRLTGLPGDRGRGRILTEKNLAGWRRANADTPADGDIQFLRKDASKALDDEYFAAVNAGDTARAQAIVNSVAGERGYSGDDVAGRMQHAAPNSRDGFSVSLAKARDSGMVPDDYWTHPRNYQYESYDFESHAAVMRAMESRANGGKGLIHLFRAIPKDAKDSKFRNGDWVTPSRRYAELSGKEEPGGYRIIENVAPIDHVWWDGNSINELGYDDGKGYVYADTRNNRKLSDAIVRDYKGNIVPPSKRFDKRKLQAFFSRDGEVGSGMDVRDAQDHADAIRAKWANGPDVVVARDMNDPQIPQQVRDVDQKQRSGGATGEPEGFYYQGKVYLIASQLHGQGDVARVLFHEALGHHGLRGVFGSHLDGILTQIAAMRQSDVVAKGEEYGLVPAGLPANASLSDKWRAMGKAARLQAAEEVLAGMSQTRPDLGYVKRAVAAVKTWLRQNVPGFRNLRLSDDEIIRSFILPARGFVERGAEQAGVGGRLAAAFSRGDTDKTIEPVKLTLEGWQGGTSELSRLAREVYTRDLQGTTVPNASLGADIAFTAEGKGEAFGARGRIRGQARAEIVRVLRDVVGRSVKVAESDPQGRADTRKFHTLVSSLDVNGENYAVKVTVRESKLVPDGDTPHKFYDVTTVEIKRSPEGNGLQTAGTSSRPPATGASGSSVSELARTFNIDANDGGARFSRAAPIGEARQDARSAAERAQDIIDSKVGRFRPLEAVAHAATRYTGIEKLTQAAGRVGGRLLDRYTPEAVKAALVSDYGVPEKVIDQRVLMQGRKLVQLRQTGELVDKLSTLTNQEAEAAYDWMTSKDPAAMRGLAELPDGSVGVLQDVQKMIDRLSRDAVDLGLLSQSAYERNKGAYLHRSYAKHVLDQEESSQGRGGGRGTAVLGANLHRRGIDQTARMDQIRQSAPEWWDVARREGKADPDLIGRMVTRLERRAHSGEGTEPLPGMDAVLGLDARHEVGL